MLALAIVAGLASAWAQELESVPPGPVPDQKPGQPIAGYQIVSSTTPEAVQTGSRYGWNAECPAPKVALGGGYTLGDAFNPDPELLVLNSSPSVSFEGSYDGKIWHVEVKNLGPNPSYFTVYAVCALPGR